MAESTLPEPGPIVTSWTKLQIPPSTSIENEASEDGRKWLLLSKNHNLRDQPGFLRACFGRVIESSETVWYITGWESTEALNAFELSKEYHSQREQLSSWSLGPLETHRCHLKSKFWEHFTDNIGIMDACFPSSISDEQKQKAESVRGLVYFFAPGASKPSAYRTRGDRGWVQGTTEFEGQKYLTLRFVNFWNSEESERHFKASAGIMLKGGRYISLYDHLVEQLKEAGMLASKEFHCKFFALPNFYEPSSS